MVSLLTLPPPVILAGLPAWFVVEAAEGATRVVAKIYDSESNLVGSEQAFVDQDLKASFELSQYFYDSLKPVTELNPDVAIALNNTIAKPFTVQFFEDDQEEGNSTTHTALKGDLHDHVKKLISYGTTFQSFYAWLVTTMSFLSFRPSEINIYEKSQPEKLHFLITESAVTTAVVKCRITNDLGAETTHTLATINDLATGNVIEINAGYDALGIDDLLAEGRTLRSYIIYVEHSGTPISKEITFTWKPYFSERINHFLFLNPAGGFDCFAATGNSETETEYRPELVSILPAPGQDQASINRLNFQIQDKETVHSGFLSPALMAWLPQLPASPTPFWVKDNKLIPVLFTDASILRLRSVREMLFASLQFFVNLQQVTEDAGTIPTLAATVTVTNVVCWGSDTGSIVFSAQSGGSGTYQYSIDNGATWQNSATFDTLPAATYRPVMRDLEAPQIRKAFGTRIITQPDRLEANLVITDTITGQSIGKIHFGSVDAIDPDDEFDVKPPTGGSGTYEYTINGGTNWQTSALFENLAAGTYDCRMRDQANPACVRTINATAVVGAVALVALSADVARTNLACSENNTGTIIITNPTGGSGEGYLFSIDDGATWKTQTNYTGLPVGAYVVKMKDSTGTVETLDSFSLIALSSIPANPATLTGTSVYRGVNLAWTNNADNDLGTVVEYREAGTLSRYTSVYFENPGLNAVHVDFSNPDDWLKTYEFRVSQYNNCGTSATTNTVSVTPGGAAPAVPVIARAFQASEFGNSQPCEGVRLDWDPVTNATYYEFRRNSDNNPVARSVGRTSGQTYAYDPDMKEIYTDTHDLTYQIRACNAFGCSAWSTEAIVPLTCVSGTEYDPANY